MHQLLPAPSSSAVVARGVGSALSSACERCGATTAAAIRTPAASAAAAMIWTRRWPQCVRGSVVMATSLGVERPDPGGGVHTTFSRKHFGGQGGTAHATRSRWLPSWGVADELFWCSVPRHWGRVTGYKEWGAMRQQDPFLERRPNGRLGSDSGRSTNCQIDHVDEI